MGWNRGSELFKHKVYKVYGYAINSCHVVLGHKGTQVVCNAICGCRGEMAVPVDPVDFLKECAAASVAQETLSLIKEPARNTLPLGQMNSPCRLLAMLLDLLRSAMGRGAGGLCDRY